MANSPHPTGSSVGSDDPSDLLAPGDDTAQPANPLQLARDELGEICGQINNGHSRLVDLMRRVLADELWAGAGLKSPEHWLTAFAGVAWSSAHDIVRIARRADELPRMSTLLDNGRLTLGQAAVVAKYTPAAYDEDVAEFASYATVTQLRRSLTRYEFNADTVADDDGSGATAYLPDGAVDDVETQQQSVDAAEQRAPDLFDPATAAAQLHMRYAAGRFKLTYEAPADIGALVEQALLEAKDALFALRRNQSRSADAPDGKATSPHSPASPPPNRSTLGEAMAVLAERSLDTGAPVGGSRADRYRVYLHLDTAGNAWLQKGAAIPPSLRDRMICDGSVQPIWETEGRPVNVGRSQRIVPARTRRILEDRDRGCRFPGCLALHNLECHHLDHWINGGATDDNRLIMLCRFHHHEHHRGAFTIVGDPSRRDGVIFTERGGAAIGPTRPNPRGPSPTGCSPDPPEPTPTEPDPAATTPAARDFAPYAGPTNDPLHLAWVRFDPRRATDIGPVERIVRRNSERVARRNDDIEDDPDPPGA
ncbi:HNH endonuclease signature motif containing protein [Flexivirga meconopsidis]|uniref:HNH endonuclease signature motif containing protein n=1 Tax=Flexivirga meconopsidis TaxID=2977121 RepID=UPI00223E9650